MVKTPPSHAGGGASMPGQEAEIPHDSVGKSKPLNRNNSVTNSIKTLKMVYIKKKKKNSLKAQPSAQARGWEKALQRGRSDLKSDLPWTPAAKE